MPRNKDHVTREPKEYGKWQYDEDKEIPDTSVRRWRKTGKWPSWFEHGHGADGYRTPGLRREDEPINDGGHRAHDAADHGDSLLHRPGPSAGYPNLHEATYELGTSDGYGNTADNTTNASPNQQYYPDPSAVVMNNLNHNFTEDSDSRMSHDSNNALENESIHDSDLETADETGGVTDDSNDSELSVDFNDEYEYLFDENYSVDGEERMDVDELREQPNVKEMKIYDSCRINQFQSELLIMAKALRFNNCDRDLEFTLKLINVHLPENVYPSKYLYLKSFPQSSMTYYYYCPDCEAVIEFGLLPSAVCDRCQKVYQLGELKQRNNFFIYMSLRQQLMSILQSDLAMHLRRECVESDIINGAVYREMRRSGIIGDHDISVGVNTDGVVPFKHTQRKLWPILLTINELPPRIRKNNVIPVAIWFGDKKPKMNMYLKPFVDDIEKLDTEGFMCSIFGEEDEKLVKVHLLSICADTPAKADVLNMSHHGGKYSCPHCLSQGTVISVGGGHARVHSGGRGVPRTQNGYYEDMRKILTEKAPVHGYKGRTVISKIKSIDVVNSLPPDYMHCALLGVVLSFLEAWFATKNKNEPFYLGRQKAEFNRRMKAIKPPSEITRLPTDVLKDNKASQLKNILLYYSLPSLYGLMKEEYYNHWLLFVYGMTLLLQDKVADANRNSAGEAIEKFVSQIELLYGQAHMKFNAHLLLHLARYVRLFGGLWAWSAFPYESFNGVLAKLYHGSQHVAEQICKTALRIRQLRNQARVFNSADCDAAVTELFFRLTTASRLHRVIEHGNDLRVCGAGKDVTDLNPSFARLIENEVGFKIDTEIILYNRFIFERKVFTTSSYTRAEKRANHFVIMNNSDYVEITHLLCVNRAGTDEKQYVVLGRRFNDLKESLCRSDNVDSQEIFTIARANDDIACYLYPRITHKLVGIQMTEGRVCFVKIVNSFETD